MTLRAALLAISVAVLAGCGVPQPFNATRSEEKLRAMLDEQLPPAAEPAQVQAALTGLGVKPIDQVLTDDPAGPRLQAWVWEPGGPWPPETSEDFFNWVTLLFRFDPAGHLQDYDVEHHSVLGLSMRVPGNPRFDPQVRRHPDK